jgi:GDPmannose 4,6-dehydratase
MSLVPEQDEARDHVMATGTSRPLKGLLGTAFTAAAWAPAPHGDVLIEDMRLPADVPADVPDARGAAARARSELGWSPQVSFEEVVVSMVEADVERLSRRIGERVWGVGFRRRPLGPGL